MNINNSALKVLVCGYFGYETNQLDGQTVKTRDVYSLLVRKCRDQVSYFDTQSFKNSKLKLLTLLVTIAKSDVVFYLPAHGNLKFIFPLIYIVAKLFSTKINYLVVGGWLFEFLKNKPIHRYMLRRIKGIYTETDDLYHKLQNHDFNNVHKLHNFRLVSYPTIDFDLIRRANFRLIFMARVHPLKGVDVLFKLDDKLKVLGIRNVSIDIYGPIYDDFKPEFFEKIESSSINYCGVLEPNEVHDVLKKYDLMLFPTKYYTEGFPGTVLDAYISGIPVIASNWLNANEFIDHGRTGYISDFDNIEMFLDNTIDLLKTPENILELKRNVGVKREEYSSNKAWEILGYAIYD